MGQFTALQNPQFQVIHSLLNDYRKEGKNMISTHTHTHTHTHTRARARTHTYTMSGYSTDKLSEIIGGTKGSFFTIGPRIESVLLYRYG